MKHGRHAGRGQEEGAAALASVSVLDGPPPATSGGEVADMYGADWVPADLLRVWEGVYRDYLATSRQMDAGDIGKAAALARASARVAVTWRRMADAVSVREWWLRAALLTAAEAMEQQARDWSAYLGWPVTGEGGAGDLP